MGHEDTASVPGAPAADPAARRAAAKPGRESGPELPPQRAPETPAAPRVPAQAAPADPEAPREGEPALADEPASAPAVAPLGARERAVLDFERRRWKHAGAKDEAIRVEFDLSPTRYHQILNALLDDPAALAYAPALVNRLRRIRAARQRARH